MSKVPKIGSFVIFLQNVQKKVLQLFLCFVVMQTFKSLTGIQSCLLLLVKLKIENKD